MAMDFSKSTNANNLKKIQQKSNENSNNVVAININLSEIDKNEDNEKIFNMSDIEYLAKGIEEEGFFGAIEVYRKPDGRYEISAGHRRYEAMKYLKKDTIPCIVKEIPDDETRAKKLLSSNLRNRKLSPMDMARAIDYYEKILTNSKKKKNFIKQAAEYFNLSEIQIYRYQCLNRIIPELQQLTEKQGFPYSALQNAVSLTESGQKELYKTLIQFMQNNDNAEEEIGITRARIESIIKGIREKKENQKKPYTKKNKEIIKEASKKEEDNKVFEMPGFTPLENEIQDISSVLNNDNVYEEKIKDLDAKKIKDIKAQINKLQDALDSIDIIDKESAEESINIFYKFIEEIKIKSR